MASMAGQPEYVGVMVTWTAGTMPPSSAWFLRHLDVAQDAEVRDGEDRDFGVADGGGDRPGLLLGGVALGGVAALGGFRFGDKHFHGAYQLAPGCSRASTCISARM